MTDEAELSTRIAADLGLTVTRPSAGGSFGAFHVRTADGADAILKILPEHPALRYERTATAMRCADAMRDRGVPVPRYLDAGVRHGRVFTLQELVDGEVPSVLYRSHMRQLVRMWRAQREAGAFAVDDGRQWVDDVMTALRSGTEELFVDHELLRRSADHRVRRLLDLAIYVGRRTDPSVLCTSDVVHADLHHANVFVDGDDVVAVIDWEGARVGDARLDLAGMATVIPQRRLEPGARAYLERVVADEVPAEVSQIAAALGTLQRLTFAERSRPDLLEWAIELAGPLQNT